MSFPSDILLPTDAKYFSFVDQNYNFNPGWDINWSFEYALSGLSSSEYAICTFLSTTDTLTGFPGHYLGYTGTVAVSSYLLDDDGNILLDDDGNRLYVDSDNGFDSVGILAIAFDSSGLFALSSTKRPGVGLGSIKKDSLVIRDSNNNVTFYEQLSNINTNFVFASAGKYFQKLRFRFANMGKKLSIDYLPFESSSYETLTAININIETDNYPTVNVGFSYMSPVSSLKSPSTLYLKNFHIQGDQSNVILENSTFQSILPTTTSNYTTLCSVSAG